MIDLADILRRCDRDRLLCDTLDLAGLCAAIFVCLFLSGLP